MNILVFGMSTFSFNDFNAFTFTLIHLADSFMQSNLHSI